MIAVVTGSSGFIGSQLVRRLVGSGWRVRRLLRPGSPDRPSTGLEPPAAAEAARASLDPDADAASRRALDAALADADIVVHLAGVTRARDDAGFRRGNVEPTTALVRALERTEAGARLVLMSSQAAAGPAGDDAVPVRECDEPRPVEGYGRSKLEAERVAHARRGGETVVVRPSAVYGPGDRDFLGLFRSARLGVAVVPGSADRLLDVVHVDDLLDGLEAATTVPGVGGRTFFLGAEATSWRRLYELAGETVTRRPVIVEVPDRVVAGLARVADLLTPPGARPSLLSRHKVALSAQHAWLCASDAARGALGYAPSRALPAGLRATYLWYLENGWL